MKPISSARRMKHQDFIGAVAVRVDEALALEHFDERIQLEIPARREHVLAGFLFGVVVLPLLAIGLGASEGVADDVFHSLARGRKPLGVGLRLSTLACDVLAKGELDTGKRTLEDEIASACLPVPQLDHDGLAADRIGAAMEDVRRCRPTGQITIDVDVRGIEDLPCRSSELTDTLPSLMASLAMCEWASDESRETNLPVAS